MSPPVSRPARRHAIGDHAATQIPDDGRDAPRGSPRAAGRALRGARQRRPIDQQMTARSFPDDIAQQIRQMIAGSYRISSRARMTGPTFAAELYRRNASQTNARPFLAPDRAVTVPETLRRADEVRAVPWVLLTLRPARRGAGCQAQQQRQRGEAHQSDRGTEAPTRLPPLSKTTPAATKVWRSRSTFSGRTLPPVSKLAIVRRPTPDASARSVSVQSRPARAMRH